MPSSGCSDRPSQHQGSGESLNTIARELNRRLVPTKNAGLWQANTSFAFEETEAIWRGRVSRRLPLEIRNVARRKLRMRNDAGGLRDLAIPPAIRPEALRGDRKGQPSVRINDRWRICFRWVDGNCRDVEIVDYHG